MNGESYRLKQSRQAAALRPAADLPDAWTPPASLPLIPFANNETIKNLAAACRCVHADAKLMELEGIR